VSNALFNSEIKSLGLHMYFIIQSFGTLSCLRMFAIMSDAIKLIKRLLGLDPSIHVGIHFKGSLALTHILRVLNIGYIIVALLQ